MDIMQFRIAVESMLETLPHAHQCRAREHIHYTLNILRQETMSIEAVAIIISYTKENTDDLQVSANS